MIKIRYSDLPGGLHVRAEVQGRHKVLYLLPGLTAAQRTAAIRRARSAARVGHGPRLPALGLARARAADRIRATVGNGLAAMRVHPALCVPPMVVILAGTAAYLVLVSFSGRILPPAVPHEASRLGSQDTVQRPGIAGPVRRRGSGAVPGGTGPAAVTVRTARRHARATSPDGSASPVPSATPSPSSSPSLPPHTGPMPEPSSSQPASHVPSPSPSPSPSLSVGGGTSPVPSPSPSLSATAASVLFPPPTASPSLSATAGSGRRVAIAPGAAIGPFGYRLTAD